MRTRIVWSWRALACLLSGRTAAAGERYALIVTGASGGDAHAQSRKWRVAFAATLRDTFAYTPDRMFVLAESESDGVEKATRKTCRRGSANYAGG
jgi:hypothetical protein